MQNNPIIRWIKNANEFIEQMILNLSVLFLLIGLITSSFDVLSAKIDINRAPWFTIAWSFVQACVLDGLFYSVWVRVRDTDRRTQLGQKIWYAFVGVLLGIVSAIMTMIATVQGFSNGVSVELAMHQLGIDPGTFAVTRAIILIVVAILVFTLPKEEQASVQQTVDPQTHMLEALNKTLTMLLETNKQGQTTVQEVSETAAVPELSRPVQDSRDTDPDMQTVPGVSWTAPKVSKTHKKITVQVSHKDEREERVRQALLETPNGSVRSIAQALSMAPSSVHTIMKRLQAAL